MRPISIAERGISTLYGTIPSTLVQVGVRAVFGLLEQPDYTFWEFIQYTVNLCRDCADEVYLAEAGLPPALGAGIPLLVEYFTGMRLPRALGSGMYAMFYFTFGRSLGHMAVNAHIVDRRTGRPMRNWQKAVRGALQVVVNANAAAWLFMSGISVLLALADRRNRSLFDFAAGTVVIVGEPTEEEPESEKARESVLNRTLGRLTGRRSAPERG